MKRLLLSLGVLAVSVMAIFLETGSAQAQMYQGPAYGSTYQAYSGPIGQPLMVDTAGNVSVTAMVSTVTPTALGVVSGNQTWAVRRTDGGSTTSFSPGENIAISGRIDPVHVSQINATSITTVRSNAPVPVSVPNFGTVFPGVPNTGGAAITYVPGVGTTNINVIPGAVSPMGQPLTFDGNGMLVVNGTVSTVTPSALAINSGNQTWTVRYVNDVAMGTFNPGESVRITGSLDPRITSQINATSISRM